MNLNFLVLFNCFIICEIEDYSLGEQCILYCTVRFLRVPCGFLFTYLIYKCFSIGVS